MRSGYVLLTVLICCCLTLSWGQQIFPFEAYNLKGEARTFSTNQKPLVIQLFHGNEEEKVLRGLKMLHQKYGAFLEIVPLYSALDSPNILHLKQVHQEAELPFPIYLDMNREVARALQQPTIPLTLLIAPGGKIAYQVEAKEKFLPSLYHKSQALLGFISEKELQQRLASLKQPVAFPGEKPVGETEELIYPEEKEKPAEQQPEQPQEEKMQPEEEDTLAMPEEEPNEEEPTEEQPADEEDWLALEEDEMASEEESSDEQPTEEQPADEEDEMASEEESSDEQPTEEQPADEEDWLALEEDEMASEEESSDEQPAEEQPADEEEDWAALEEDEMVPEEEPGMVPEDEGAEGEDALAMPEEEPSDEQPAEEQPADEEDWMALEEEEMAPAEEETPQPEKQPQETITAEEEDQEEPLAEEEPGEETPELAEEDPEDEPLDEEPLFMEEEEAPTEEEVVAMPEKAEDEKPQQTSASDKEQKLQEKTAAASAEKSRFQLPAFMVSYANYLQRSSQTIRSQLDYPAKKSLAEEKLLAEPLKWQVTNRLENALLLGFGDLIVKLLPLFLWGWAFLYCFSKCLSYKNMVLATIGSLGFFISYLGEFLLQIPAEVAILAPVLWDWQLLLGNYQQTTTALHLDALLYLVFITCIVAGIAGRLTKETSFAAETN